MTSDQNPDAASQSGAFDLTARPWLPVQFLDGREAELSLREVFARAEEIRRVAGDVPTQEFALTRLLLAILHDALDGPDELEDWAELWEAAAPFAPVAGYLDAHRDRFDLLHPVTPFFQVADLRTETDEVSRLARIVADVPNNEPLFTMRFPTVARIGFAEAARWVVHAQAYDTSGIKTGVVGDPRAKGGRAYPQGVAWAGALGGVLAEGGTLRETLLLNLIAADSEVVRGGSDDRPSWRRPPTGPAAAKDLAARPTGVRDLYTWQSRRLRLHHDPNGVHGVVLTYGDPLAVQNMQDIEPMTGWRRSQAQEKKLGRPLVYMPREHDPARAAWRGLEALIAPRDHGVQGRGEPERALRPGLVHWLAQLVTNRFLPRDTLIRLRTYGAVYGTQQSVIDEITADAVALAVVLLNADDPRLGQTAVDAVSVAEAAVTSLGHLAADLATAAGAEPEPRQDAARTRGFAALDAPYRRWLGSIRDGDDPQALQAAWQRTARTRLTALAGEIVAAVGPAAWQGRVIEHPGGSSWLDASSADLRFRVRLRKDLPLAAEPASAAAVEAPDTLTPEVPA
ncbi:type I-E CRISPR-associated protein Cse1/CasA [Mangrovactinospora gilvigrisea]|uniref:Type I-E CRISPR-associated protein Cse1/CasA n=1 Tax=Mangrovactinospora gilvigrisea TaxID=1428644 RepID=A0A1J7CEV1_9ACTN|nr:type I-E CRISPR-associated protein Cse1/CasA [Mangrovactinospora gilvigrisea]OIV38218.1 type I-E CRISPR-associated protein Cse1/CasA [Mangrovactinospora gilvigrisea]